MKKVFKLYSSCILVKGSKRTCICDTQRGEIYFLSKSLANILVENVLK
jgi:hypothetical protein